ncbi:MAG: CHASE4 domain-containing protein [Thermodesulfobacteriota bacterium]
MRIRPKVLLSIAVLSLCLTPLFYFLFLNIVLGTFDQIENRFVQGNLVRLQAALEEQTKNLDTITHDWASWDDTYHYIQNRNKKYEETNIVIDTFTASAKIDFLLLFDTEGKLLHGSFLDNDRNDLIPVPSQVLSQLAANKQLFHHPDPGSHFTGFIVLADMPLLLSARPILRSNGDGPCKGTLIMMRIINEQRLETIRSIAGLSFTLETVTSSRLHPEDIPALDALLKEPSAPILIPLSRDRIAGYTLIDDVFHRPLFLLRSDSTREIHMQGHRTLNYLLWSTILTSIICSLVFFIILDKLVLKRVARLNNDVIRISKTAHPASRVQVSGADELASLAFSVNEMLDAIDKSQLELKEKEVRLRTIAEFTRSGLFITQGPKMIYVNSVMELITGYGAEELFSMNWWDIFHPDYRVALRTKIMESQKVGAPPEQYEVMIVRKDGTEGWLDLRIKHVTFQGNPASFAVCTDL